MSKDPNRELAESRFNMGQDPGGAYGNLSQKYHDQQNNSGGGGQCFTGDTKILTIFGWKNIRDFKRNDMVLSYSVSKKSLIERKILKKSSTTRIAGGLRKPPRRGLKAKKAPQGL